jgi:hypothetical protein
MLTQIPLLGPHLPPLRRHRLCTNSLQGTGAPTATQLGRNPANHTEDSMIKLSLTTVSALALALPVFAQTPPPPSQNNSPAAISAPATHNTSGAPTANGYNTPSARNSTLTDNGELRASKIVGSSVYNDHDEKVGSIDDLVIGHDKSLNAVISVGGFLGMGSKTVQVPFDKLQFGNTKQSSDNRVVLPGATKSELQNMPDYHYTNQG